MRIGFELHNDEFEYDIRGLLMAFFPGAEIVYRPEDKTGFDHYFAFPRSECARKLDRKNEIKEISYHMLSELTGKELPWGALTGIRPVKLASAMLHEGADTDEITARMMKEHMVSREKASLAADIAVYEDRILKDIDYDGGYSLYVGIPFCPTTCLYCSFTSYPIGKWAARADEYLDKLETEMETVSRLMAGKKLQTIYIGGGTPTSLSPQQLDRLLSDLRRHFDTGSLLEWTVEGGRPDSITPEKLQVLKDNPVTRISINPQTMQDETLRRIGRRHTVADLLSAYELARNMGFTNINMDTILGLPGETVEDVRDTFAKIRALSPDSLTVHSLAVKRASRLKMEAEGTVVAGGTQEESEEMMRIAAAAASDLGMSPYYLYRQKNMAGNLENVGYCRPGAEGIYNILIMEEVQTICAIGAGTVSKGVFPDGRIERCENVKDIAQYLERIDEMNERKIRLFGCGD